MKSFCYKFPSAAKYGRVIPKSKILENSSRSRKLRQLFIDEVEKIEWLYKLSVETINLPAADDVYEIQIISITQRKPKLNTDILLAVDKAIPSRIIFINGFEDKIRYSAAYKRKSEADKTKKVISGYFHTSWVEPGKIEERELPVALNLNGLYERLFLSIIPFVKKDEESLAGLIERCDMIQSLEKEVSALKKKMLLQKQFNRKVEINGELKMLQGKLEDLV
jgi:hypothetical protein